MKNTRHRHSLQINRLDTKVMSDWFPATPLEIPISCILKPKAAKMMIDVTYEEKPHIACTPGKQHHTNRSLMDSVERYLYEFMLKEVDGI